MLGELELLAQVRCQLLVLCRSPDVPLTIFPGSSPALMKLMVNFVSLDFWQVVTALQMLSAMVLSNWSRLQQYRPSPRAFGQQLNMCSRDPFFWQRVHYGDLAKPQQYTVGQMGWGEHCRQPGPGT